MRSPRQKAYSKIFYHLQAGYTLIVDKACRRAALEMPGCDPQHVRYPHAVSYAGHLLSMKRRPAYPSRVKIRAYPDAALRSVAELRDDLEPATT